MSYNGDSNAYQDNSEDVPNCDACGEILYLEADRSKLRKGAFNCRDGWRQARAERDRLREERVEMMAKIRAMQVERDRSRKVLVRLVRAISRGKGDYDPQYDGAIVAARAALEDVKR